MPATASFLPMLKHAMLTRFLECARKLLAFFQRPQNALAPCRVGFVNDTLKKLYKYKIIP